MSLEHYQVGGIDLCALRQSDGRLMIVTSILARTLGISDGVRRALDTKARTSYGLSRGWLDQGSRPCLVDMVPANDLRRYADLLWSNRARMGRAAENKVWQLRAALKSNRRNGGKAGASKTAQVDFFRPCPALTPKFCPDPL
jgi:hypothetical protein